MRSFFLLFLFTHSLLLQADPYRDGLKLISDPSQIGEVETHCPGQSDSTKLSTLLEDSLDFFHEKVRIEESGFYLDYFDLSKKAKHSSSSSSAANGMGIVSLVISHQIGQKKNQEELIIKTLEASLKKRESSSKLGWMRHWFDAKTGEDNFLSKADGYSTVDTAIFVAGAQFAATHFKNNPKIVALADQALRQVDWESAVVDAEKGSMVLKFDLDSQLADKGRTLPFNEYSLVACMGALLEEKNNSAGVMTKFWDKHFKDPKNKLKKEYKGKELLTDHPDHFLSSFVMQFSMYLCPKMNNSKAYLKEWEKMAKADRQWFKDQGYSPYQWGLGAGDVKVRNKDGSIHEFYAANKIEDNPQHVISPYIIAGSIPVDSKAAGDLVHLSQEKYCSNEFEGLNILWRCSLKDPSLKFTKVSSIDYASFFLGLSTLHPKLDGFKFYQESPP